MGSHRAKGKGEAMRYDAKTMTRFGCKQCGDIFVRPKVENWAVIFVESCKQHVGWIPEEDIDFDEDSA